MSNEAQQLNRRDLQWCMRRLPQRILKLLHDEGPRLILAGGFIRSCVSNERVSDIDLFGPSKEYLAVIAGTLKGEKHGARLVDTQNAYTVYGYGLPIQMIHRWTYQRPEDVVASFDFTTAQAAIWCEGGGRWRSMTHPDFYPDLAAKRLIYTWPVRNEDAGGSMLRVLKFYQREHRITLDSLAGVITRLLCGVDRESYIARGNVKDIEWGSKIWQRQMAKVLTGLLREVDPNVDPLHRAHLPTLDEQDEDKALEEAEAEAGPAAQTGGGGEPPSGD